MELALCYGPACSSVVDVVGCTQLLWLGLHTNLALEQEGMCTTMTEIREQYYWSAVLSGLPSVDSGTNSMEAAFKVEEANGCMGKRATTRPSDD